MLADSVPRVPIRRQPSDVQPHKELELEDSQEERTPLGGAGEDSCGLILDNSIPLYTNSVDTKSQGSPGGKGPTRPM